MTGAILHPIDRIAPLPGYRLRIWWRSGGESVIDFADDVATGPVWAPLCDPVMFAKVCLVDQGTAIEWPEPKDRNGWPSVDVDADGLWHMAQRQRGAVAAE